MVCEGDKIIGCGAIGEGVEIKEFIICCLLVFCNSSQLRREIGWI